MSLRDDRSAADPLANASLRVLDKPASAERNTPLASHGAQLVRRFPGLVPALR